MVLMASGVVLWGGLTIHRAKQWGNPIALMQDTIEQSPDFLPARKDLANLYLRAGEKDKAEQLLAGVVEQAGSLEYSSADIEMAMLLAKQGQFDEARRLLRKRLENSGKKYAEVANALLKVNQERLARLSDREARQAIHLENAQLLEVLKQRSPDPFLSYRLAKEYLAMDDQQRARNLFEEAWHSAPPSAHYREPARKLAETLAAGQHD
jgi:protein O-mannosyl-transferase